MFLDGHPELKRFALHKNTHVDFTLYNAVKKPVLVIELDGESHRKEEQIKRDEKKDTILKHINIPLWRLSSKAAISEDDFEREINTWVL